MKTKNANIELIRIVAMLFVVMHHYFRHGGGTVWPDFGTIEYIVYWCIDAFVFVCVNLFVLVSGYCLVTTEFKLSRIVRLWVEVEFYSVACTLICKFLGNEISVAQLLKSAVPFTTEAYWYVTAYAILLCFCPFINKLLDCLSKQQYIALIAAINIICVVLPTVLVWERDLITTGMDYEWLIPLYIIGGYIRKFGIPCGKNKALVGYVLCSLITGLVRVPLGLVSNRIVGSYVLSGLFFRYNSITVVMASVFLFWFLLNLNIGNDRLKRTIIWFGPLTFAVYLIHDNSNVRNILWKILPMEQLYAGGIMMYLGGLIVIAPTIFVVCCAIEKSRIQIFNQIGIQKFLHKWDLLFDEIKGQCLLLVK